MGPMAELDDATPNGVHLCECRATEFICLDIRMLCAPRAGEMSLAWLNYTVTATQPGYLSVAPSSGSTGQNVEDALSE